VSVKAAGVGLASPFAEGLGIGARLHTSFEDVPPFRHGRTRASKYAAHPECFPRGVPKRPSLPVTAWINKPVSAAVPAQPAAQRAHNGAQAGAVDQVAAFNAVDQTGPETTMPAF
jgi:hypothetical protein